MKKFEIVKRLHAGQMLPPFYGIAWHEYHLNVGVCLPIPFNLVAAMIRSIWFFLRFGYRSIEFSPRDAYAQGHRDGFRSAGRESPE